MFGALLLVLFVLLFVGVLPAWPHSRKWGYYPSSAFGLVIVVLLILLVTQRI